MNQISDSNENKVKGNLCQRIERLLLILTFICVAIGTVYSVLTSKSALNVASNELRPWIIVPRVESILGIDHLETRFEISNIGKTPAFVIVEATATINEKPVKHLSKKNADMQLVIMPGQKIFYKAFRMKGKAYRKFVNKKTDDEIMQSISVKYGISKKDTDRFWTYYKIKFDKSDLPYKPLGTYYVGIWDIVDSDFK